MQQRENALVGAVVDKLRETESAHLFSFGMGLAEWILVFFGLAGCFSLAGYLLFRFREREREWEAAAEEERKRTARALEILANAVNALAEATRKKTRGRRRA